MDTETCSDRVPRCRDNLGTHLSVEKAAALTQHKEIQARECDPAPPTGAVLAVTGLRCAPYSYSIWWVLVQLQLLPLTALDPL